MTLTPEKPVSQKQAGTSEPTTIDSVMGQAQHKLQLLAKTDRYELSLCYLIPKEQNGKASHNQQIIFETQEPRQTNFGCVLALDGLRHGSQRKHRLRPRACAPICTRPALSPA